MTSLSDLIEGSSYEIWNGLSQFGESWCQQSPITASHSDAPSRSSCLS